MPAAVDQAVQAISVIRAMPYPTSGRGDSISPFSHVREARGTMNILCLILDGLADRPQATLGGKTPLEAAHTPHLDRLAELGTTGLLIPLALGVPLESEFSHFILFGYPPENFPGTTESLKTSVRNCGRQKICFVRV